MRHATGLLCLGLATAVLWPAAPAYADGIRDQQWYLGSLNVTDAQARSRGQGMVVAVIDTGVDGSHQDLAASLLPPVTVDGSTDTGRFDPDGHGTGLAGLISAQGHGANREHGVVGIAPGAKVLPVVFRAGARPDETGRAVEADQLAAGIDLAVRRGAKVICVGYSVDGSQNLRDAVAAANRAGAIVVAADGNRSSEAFPPFPAAYDGVLAAVPLGKDGRLLVTSASGRRLGFGVPGEEIMTTNAGGEYRVDAGDASAGILAAAVALVWAAYPNLSAEEIVHRLAATAGDLGARGPDADYGQGKLDLVAALSRDVAPLRTAAPSPSPSPSSPAPSPSASPAVAAPVAPRGLGGWLLMLPLVAVVGVLAAIALRAERATPVAPTNPTLDPKV
jgi:subtilisin family serine protease